MLELHAAEAAPVTELLATAHDMLGAVLGHAHQPSQPPGSCCSYNRPVLVAAVSHNVFLLTSCQRMAQCYDAHFL